MTPRQQSLVMFQSWSCILCAVQVAGTLQKSTEVMKLVNDLIKAPQLNQTVQQMSKEMMKAGVIDEMMDDAIESAIDSDDIEEETDAEVDKVTIFCLRPNYSRHCPDYPLPCHL